MKKTLKLSIIAMSAFFALTAVSCSDETKTETEVVEEKPKEPPYRRPLTGKDEFIDRFNRIAQKQQMKWHIDSLQITEGDSVNTAVVTLTGNLNYELTMNKKDSSITDIQVHAAGGQKNVIPMLFGMMLAMECADSDLPKEKRLAVTEHLNIMNAKAISDKGPQEFVQDSVKYSYDVSSTDGYTLQMSSVQ